ncbi:MAG: aminotransferase class IV [Candidatus Sulfobium sp.]
MYIFLNGRVVKEAEACISVYDHGFLYGDGIYETMRSYGGVVFMLDRHLERLARSASLIRLTCPDRKFLRDAVYETMEYNGLSDAYVRVTVSRGKGKIGLDPRLCKEPTVVIITEGFREYPGSYYQKGTELIMARTRRNLAEALDPSIKSLNFLNNILAKTEAIEKGAYEAVMLNRDGYIAEGTVSNIFFVRDERVCTPSRETGILEGITREVTIRVAGNNGIAVTEGMFVPEDIFAAQEVFLTNTTGEVMPVSRFEHKSYRVGPISRHLHELYRNEVSRYLEEAKKSGR